MTTNQVLTDAEIAECFGSTVWSGIIAPKERTPLEVCRAVEQAVLAKVPRFSGVWCSSDGEQGVTLDGHSYTRNDTIKRGVTERDARKRERAAWEDGAMAGAHHMNIVGWRGAAEEARARYPMPTCDKCGQEIK